jgi:hypothetical protein
MSMPGLRNRDKRGPAALCALVLAAVSLAACGGSGSTGDPAAIVARVNGVGSISAGEVEHWIPVEAVVLYEENPTKAVPKGLIPVPPDYTACISYLEAHPQKSTGASTSTTTTLTPAQLKLGCAHRYQELKVLTLNTLILWDWTIAAGLKLGMTGSEAEVRRQFVETNKNLYPKAGELARYMKLTGQTQADMLFRARVSLFEAKLISRKEELEKSQPSGALSTQRQREVAAFIKYLPPGKQWAATTSCVPGYVVSACRQYRGSEPPSVPN